MKKERCGVTGEAMELPVHPEAVYGELRPSVRSKPVLMSRND